VAVKRSGKMNGLQARVESGAKEGLILAGDLIAQRAQKRVHVDTGRLKRSITRGNPFATGKGFSISVGSNVGYAKIEEFREGSKHGTPHAYLRPAIQESEREAIIIISKRVIAKMVKR
jgi:HK97 gp10 family phage protein